MANTTVPHKNTGDQLAAFELNNIIDAVNSKADLDSSGHVSTSQLPDEVFASTDFQGAGTTGSPLKINTNAIKTYLQSLPGYGTDKVLYGNMTWGDAGTGGSGQDPALDTPATPTFGAITSSSIVINWAAVANAASYILQRAQTADFSSATTVYTGTALTFANTGLASSTTYYYRLKAVAGTGFQDSAYSSNASTATASSGGGTTTTTTTTSTTTTTTTGAPSDLQPITEWLSLIFAHQTGNTIHVDDQDNAGTTDVVNAAACSTQSIPVGGTGIVQMQCPAFTETGETSTGIIGLVDNTNGFGQTNMNLCAWRLDNSLILGRNKSDSWNSAAGALPAGGYIRLRTDGTNMYAEHSSNGSTWTIDKQIPQPASVLYVQISILGGTSQNQRKVVNILASGLV